MNDMAMSGGLNGSAIAMLIFGCLVLYGGIVVCLRIAMREKPDSNRSGDSA